MSLKTNRAIKSITFGAIGVAIAILALLFASQSVHSDEASFDAYETVHDAKVGVWADDTTDDNLDDATGGYIQPYEPVKSETIYLDGGKKVCFKLESGVSVAYYCN